MRFFNKKKNNDDEVKINQKNTDNDNQDIELDEFEIKSTNFDFDSFISRFKEDYTGKLEETINPYLPPVKSFAEPIEEMNKESAQLCKDFKGAAVCIFSVSENKYDMALPKTYEQPGEKGFIMTLK